MCHRTLCGFVACLVLPMAVGCMNANHGIVRGQSPSAPAAPAAAAPQYGYGVQQAGGLYGPMDGSIQRLGGSCDQCATCGDCSGRCGHRGRLAGQLGLREKINDVSEIRNGPGGAWYPTHHHHFSYDAPRGLQYPPANVPPSVVVYPYYTVKGPDDFFFTGN